MISQGTAATCDYVEANRRTTAIAFVLDAFNGEVDTILADAQHDNHGTLRQKVVDALALVNENGGAFRNARITPEYRDARLQELRWAVVAQELKLEEREERRLIKERIRREERAQREYDKAVKDAQKEEGVLRVALSGFRVTQECRARARFGNTLCAIAARWIPVFAVTDSWSPGAPGRSRRGRRGTPPLRACRGTARRRQGRFKAKEAVVSRILAHLRLPVSPELLADACTIVYDVTDQPIPGWVVGADPEPPDQEARGPPSAED